MKFDIVFSAITRLLASLGRYVVMRLDAARAWIVTAFSGVKAWMIAAAAKTKAWFIAFPGRAKAWITAFPGRVKAWVVALPVTFPAFLARIGAWVCRIFERRSQRRADRKAAALEDAPKKERRLALREEKPGELAVPEEEIYEFEPRRKTPTWWRIVKGFLTLVWRGVATLLLIMVITGCIVGITSMVYVLAYLDKDIDFDLNDIKMNYTSAIYAYDPTEGTATVYQELHGSENRKWVDLDQIPQEMLDAVVAIEDKRFWEHNGIDWNRTAFAFINMFLHVREDTQGGSTITQQLIKNVTKEDQVSIDRKLREIFRALELERIYTKEQILEAYLNVIALGNGCNGVQAAANTYFNKDVSELDIAECASIAGITKNPTQFNPLYRAENNKKRQEWVLTEMKDQEKITPEQYEISVDEELIFNEGARYNPDIKSRNNWYVDQIIYDLRQELQTICGMTSTAANMAIYNGGLQVYSNMDLNLQHGVEAIFQDPGASNFGPFTGAVKPQCAIVVMDYTGGVKAIVGARGTKQGDQVFSMASQARRQPGSAFKPVAVYGPAIEFGILEYSTPVPNQPVTQGGKPWPKNSGYASYNGRVLPVVDGIRISANCIAVRVQREMGPQKSFDFCTQRLNFQLIENKEYIINGKSQWKNDISASLALGGLTEGVTVEEMASAYAIFGNGGKFYEPHTYYAVVDAQGKQIITHGPNDFTQAISFEAATIMNRLLRAPMSGGGTAASIKFGSLPMFGKTGTTSDNKDRYFAGGTPYYVAACWFGYEIQRPLEHTSSNYAALTWKRVMQMATPDGTPVIAFPASGNVSARSYCTISGGFAGAGCPSATGYYSSRNSGLPMCPIHAGGTPNTAYTRYLDSNMSFLTESTEPAPTEPEPTEYEPDIPIIVIPDPTDPVYPTESTDPVYPYDPAYPYDPFVPWG